MLFSRWPNLLITADCVLEWSAGQTRDCPCQTATCPPTSLYLCFQCTWNNSMMTYHQTPQRMFLVCIGGQTTIGGHNQPEKLAQHSSTNVFIGTPAKNCRGVQHGKQRMSATKVGRSICVSTDRSCTTDAISDRAICDQKCTHSTPPDAKCMQCTYPFLCSISAAIVSKY